MHTITDIFATGGNFAFMGMIMYSDIDRMIKTMRIMSDECIKYGTNYFNK